jgi:hypothetical protein
MLMFTVAALGKIISLTYFCTSRCTQIFLVCGAPNRKMVPLAELERAIGQYFEVIEIRHPQSIFQVGLSEHLSTRSRDKPMQPNAILYINYEVSPSMLKSLHEI